MPLHVVIDSDDWKSVRGLKALTQQAADAALPAAQRAKTVTVLFADDAMLTTLNHNWRGQKKPTNVLSFPSALDFKKLRGMPLSLGDIALSFETIASEAKASGLSLKAHTTHLIVHGILHLLGYDHVSAADALVMETKEIRILKKLGIADPYQ